VVTVVTVEMEVPVVLAAMAKTEEPRVCKDQSSGVLAKVAAVDKVATAVMAAAVAVVLAEWRQASMLLGKGGNPWRPT
jgi:hypothetical protein